MISMKLILYLSIGTIAMLIPMMIQGGWYGIKVWKRTSLAIILTIVGTFGAYLWFFIENHWIGGTSFYGAVFVVPILFYPIAKLVREPYRKVMDLCAPAECVMLAIMKVQCILSNCCGGRVLYLRADGSKVIFPSQIAELINALVIFAILMVLAHKKIGQGMLFPGYMCIYGVTRFVLNCFRRDQTAFFMGLPPGHVWSLLAVFCGLVWIAILRSKKQTIPS